MDKRYQVFVSSTYQDLKVERMEVMAALLELDCIPCGMEYFPAADETQWNFIQRLIDGCDYYIVIIGGKNGSTAPDGLSYTRKEYEYARIKSIPTLAFTHIDPQTLPEEHRESDPQEQKKLADFESLVKGHLCKPWKNAHHLAAVVSRSLAKLITDRPRAGWIRGKIESSNGNRSRLSQKFGRSYWVAHDLLWTVSRVLGKGSRESILEGLVGARHHLREVKYIDPSFGTRLEQIYDTAQKSSESDWTIERRHAVSKEIEHLARELGDAIKAKQKGFKAHPSRKSPTTPRRGASPESRSVIRSSVRSSTRSISFLFVSFGEVERPVAMWSAQHRPTTIDLVGQSAALPIDLIHAF